MEKMNDFEVMISIIGAFVAMLAASFFSFSILSIGGSTMILASTGASSLLVFGMPHSAASQPWNIVGGQLVSAFVGVSCNLLMSNDIIAASVAVPLAMLVMYKLRCMHPPGGATAVTAIVGGAHVQELGYAFLIIPVLFNSIIILSFALAAGSLREKNPYE
ncbi:MAG: HPP family protein [Bermanella sp.]